MERNDKVITIESENALDYMAISYADLERDFLTIEMKNEKAELYPIPMLIRAFRRSSAISEY